MPDKVYLHIGAPKTGTTYLQERLATNRKRLAAHGVHYPLPGMRLAAHFYAALDLIGQPWGFEDTEGAWDRLARAANRLDGTVVISHEVLASATRDQVRRARASFGDAEVHVVYSQRDLGRQLPAAWQESIKNRKTWTYRRYLRLARTRPRRNADWWFWKTQSLVDVLERWSEGLPPEQVHVVVVPQGHSAPEELWHRYCRAFGIDPTWALQDAGSANPSIGAAQTYLIRRLNKRLKRTELQRNDKRELVKEVLVQRNLATRGTDRVTLRPQAYPWVAEVGEEWVEWLAGSGVDVIGDPAELLPVAPDRDSWLDPDRVKPRDVVDTAVDALAVMTQEAARRTDPGRDLGSRVGEAVRRLRGQ